MTEHCEMLHPLFGTPKPGFAYTARLGAYGIAHSAQGLIAAVEGDRGKLYFPGGGVIPGETVRVALEREALEECGWTVAVGEQLGHAFQLTHGDEGNLLLEARYFRLSVLSIDHSSAEHRVVWLPAEACAERMHRACDRCLAEHKFVCGFQSLMQCPLPGPSL
jgi:8-oxo-dGTP diphosphatase